MVLMKRSVKIQVVRFLVAGIIFMIFAAIYIAPSLAAPGLLFVLILLAVQLKLWRVLSGTVVEEDNAKKQEP